MEINKPVVQWEIKDFYEIEFEFIKMAESFYNRYGCVIVFSTGKKDIKVDKEAIVYHHRLVCGRSNTMYQNYRHRKK